MADSTKVGVGPAVPPTLVERTAATVPGTMQLPAGVVLDVGAPPLLPTLAPSATTPIGAPPAMPADWRYEIRSEIARGGMGRVVEATDTVLGRVVALKEALSADPESLRRFQRETWITARLEHPSIVPVHDAGITPSGSPFYVMRKVGGRPLEELVATAEALTDRLALVPHIVAAAHAVAHAHERGIVHRDIKPSNILVGDLGETIVIDWGLAKAMAEPDTERSGFTLSREADDLRADPVIDHDAVKTRAGIVFGTPGFMSPEQLRGVAVDERCDVYALGATLYHLLARRPPHHAKTADEMMHAAITGSPTDLRELVPGVPPELATIVAKALAHDPALRYQDAGALAEDLQRFLTGQLVASHHYSPRARVVRFVRKNRALVAVTGAALAAIVIGSWLAIGRIVDERDRADAQKRIALDEKRVAEDQREQVTEKANQLTLSQARTKAQDEPTRAAAMVRPLAATTLWRQARDIAAAASAHGVAFSLPASPHTLSLELSRDGQRALAAGDDGVVRLYDLARHTSREIANARGPAAARFGDGEHTIVVFHGDQLTLIDAGTGARRDLATPTTIVALEVSGPIAYWIDPQGAAWRLDLAGGAPAKLALDEPVTAVLPSPDGRWIALAGTAHLLLVDRTNPTLPPEAVGDGAARDLAWASDASHLVALLGDEVVDIDMVPAPTVVHRQTVGNRSAVVYSAGRIFTVGPTGVALVARDETRSRRLAGDFSLGLREARGGVVVAGGSHVIAVLSDDSEPLLLASPVDRLHRVAAAPNASWMVAAGDGLVVVWNLAAALPRHVTQTAPSGAEFVTGDALIATFLDAPAQWIDLRTDKATSLGMVPGLSAVVGAPDGQRAVLVDGSHRARLVAPVGEPIELGDDVELAAFVDDRRLVLATSSGQILLGTTVLAHHAAAAVALAARPTDGGWIAAAFADHSVWRANLAAKTDAKLELAATVGRGGLALAADGTVVLAIGAQLRAWRPDGSVATLATLTKPIAVVAMVDTRRVFALAGDGSAYLVGLDRPDDVEPTLAASPTTSLAAGATLIASLTATREVEVIDPSAKERWTIARGQPFGAPRVSPDGRRVLAITPTGLLVWTLGIPQTPDDTARWLDAMTNAYDRGPSAPLGWR